MKPNRNIILTWALSLSTLSMAADKIGNGGQSVDVNGRPSLRDLVDKSVCIWHPGSAFIGRLTHMPAIFTALDNIHTSYAELLRSEAAKITVCMTEGSLIQIAAEDTDGLTIWKEFNGRQLAIRVNDRVYVDSKIFSQLDDTNKAYLLVHELLHGFIAQGTEQRNTKLRSFVNFLHQYEQANPSRDFFFTQIDMNSVDWPHDQSMLDLIDYLQAKVVIALDKKNSERERYEASLGIYPRNSSDKLSAHSLLFRMRPTDVYAIDNFRESYLKRTEQKFLALIAADDAEGLTHELAQLSPQYVFNGDLSFLNLSNPALQSPYWEQTYIFNLKKLLVDKKTKIFLSRMPTFKSLYSKIYSYALEWNEEAAAALASEFSYRDSFLYTQFSDRAVNYLPTKVIEAILNSSYGPALLSYTCDGKTALKWARIRLKDERYSLKQAWTPELTDLYRRHVAYWEQVIELLLSKGAT